jgi:YHS domain-containing protein
METNAMQTLIERNGRGPDAHAAPAARTSRRSVRAWWRLARHLGEMVVAMLVGMAALGGVLAAVGRLPGNDTLVGEYAWMGVAMSVPMVLWMRRMGHSWFDGLEMSAWMVVPMYALVLPVALGAVAMAPMALMGWAHVAMIGGMALLMVYRWDTYAGGHCHAHAAAPVGAARATDPVCGMAVDPATAKSAEHEGTTYRFCSPGCRKTFTKDPATYLAADYLPSM